MLEITCACMLPLQGWFRGIEWSPTRLQCCVRSSRICASPSLVPAQCNRIACSQGLALPRQAIGVSQRWSGCTCDWERTRFHRCWSRSPGALWSRSSSKAIILLNAEKSLAIITLIGNRMSFVWRMQSFSFIEYQIEPHFALQEQSSWDQLIYSSSTQQGSGRLHKFHPGNTCRHRSVDYTSCRCLQWTAMITPSDEAKMR